MSMLRIPRLEQGVIRVFAISRPIADMARALAERPKTRIAAELLAHPVEAGDFELFALSDLAGMGLMTYLIEGYDIDPAAPRADRARLEALDGYVLLLFSAVAREADVALTPSADLTLIGTYAEPKPDHAAAPIAAEAARPYSGVKEQAQGRDRARLGRAAAVVSALLVISFIWWILR